MGCTGQTLSRLTLKTEFCPIKMTSTALFGYLVYYLTRLEPVFIVFWQVVFRCSIASIDIWCPQ